MSRPSRAWKCTNSGYSDYEISSGYGTLLDDKDIVEIPLAPVPPDVKRMASGGLNSGAEEYAELHRELWDRTREYLKTI